jgi:hypothetical protein
MHVCVVYVCLCVVFACMRACACGQSERITQDTEHQVQGALLLSMFYSASKGPKYTDAYIQAGVRLRPYTDVMLKSCLDNLGASAAGRKPSAGHHHPDRASLQGELKNLRAKFNSQIVRRFVHYRVFRPYNGLTTDFCSSRARDHHLARSVIVFRNNLTEIYSRTHIHTCARVCANFSEQEYVASLEEDLKTITDLANKHCQARFRCCPTAPLA